MWKVVTLAMLGLAMLQCCGPREGRQPNAARDAPAPLPGPAPAGAPGILRLGLKPFLCGSTGQMEDFSAFGTVLSRELGTQLVVIPLNTYQEVIDQFSAGNLDLAIVSSLAYVRLTDREPDAALMATLVVNGSVFYSSYFLAKEGSAIRELSDVHGKKIGLVNECSGSGYLYPVAFLLDNGFSAREIKEQITFFGNHTAAVEGLLKGEVDITASFYGAFGVLRMAKEQVQQVRVVAVAGRMPYEAFVARKSLGPETLDRVREVLLRINTTTKIGREAFGHQVDINGWAESGDELYQPIREDLHRIGQALGEGVHP